MARSSGLDPSEAFELFLDTICNTFGGILFLAILVVIMIQLTSPLGGRDPQDKSSASQLRTMQDELAQIELDVRTLEETRRTVSAQRQALLKDAEDPLAKAYSELAAQADDARVKHEQAVSELQATQEQVESLRQELHTQEEKIRQAEVALREAQKQLSDASKSNALRLRLPVDEELKASGGAPPEAVAMLIRGEKLIFLFDYDGTRRTGINTEEVEFDEARKIIMPKPGAGRAFEDATQLGTFLNERLAIFDREGHYLVIAVWPDSYRMGELLRDAAIKRRYGYSLVLVEEGKPIQMAPGAPRGFNNSP